MATGIFKLCLINRLQNTQFSYDIRGINFFLPTLGQSPKLSNHMYKIGHCLQWQAVEAENVEY